MHRLIQAMEEKYKEATSIYLEALKRNIKIYDLTCPNVLKIHDKAKKLDVEGYFIILIAQKTHPEAIGTISFCGENSVICENEEDLSLDDLEEFDEKELEGLGESYLKRVYDNVDSFKVTRAVRPYSTFNTV